MKVVSSQQGEVTYTMELTQKEVNFIYDALRTVWPAAHQLVSAANGANKLRDEFQFVTTRKY